MTLQEFLNQKAEKIELQALKEELKLAKSQGLLDEIKTKVLEAAIAKDLPKVCNQCGETKYLTLDHIVPESLLKDLGVMEVIEDNYQTLCRYCNQKKANRIDIREPKVKEILKKIVNNL